MNFSTDFKLGILGGGQLGKMMFDTRKFDIQTYVLVQSEAPCKIACDQILQRRFDGF
jgi:5-(carboxyamino)imidazole ribonucleotide synthase